MYVGKGILVLDCQGEQPVYLMKQLIDISHIDNDRS